MQDGAPAITWVGHSTVLLELDGVRLLTDPVLRERMIHLRRVSGGADVGALHDVDALLISHLHYDHLDVKSLEPSAAASRVVVPVGAGDMLRSRGFAHVIELEVGDDTDVNGVNVSATHAEHGGRQVFRMRVPALGYLVSGSVRIWFAGDTDLFDGMRHARARPRRRAAARGRLGAARASRAPQPERAADRRSRCSTRASPCRSTGARTGGSGSRAERGRCCASRPRLSHASPPRSRPRSRCGSCPSAAGSSSRACTRELRRDARARASAHPAGPAPRRMAGLGRRAARRGRDRAGRLGQRLGGALVAAALIAILNAMLPPVIAALRLPFTLVLGFLLVLFLDALMLKLASDIAPGAITVDSFWWALVAAFVAAIVSVVLDPIFRTNDDETLHAPRDAANRASHRRPDPDRRAGDHLPRDRRARTAGAAARDARRQRARDGALGRRGRLRR